MNMLRKTLSSLLVILVLVLSLCSCGSSVLAADKSDACYNYEEDYDYGYENQYVSAESDKDISRNAAEDDSMTVEKSKNSGQTKSLSDRKLVRNASVYAQTKALDTFLSSIEQKVNEMNGYTEAMQIDGNGYYGDGYRSASVTVRVPADKFDDFLNCISQISAVTSKSVSVSDITSQYIDTESHIKALEAEQTALLAILKKASDVSETLEVYSRLSEVNASLESYKSTLKSYDNQVSYSKIDIHLSEVEREIATEKEGFFAEIKRKLSDNLYSLGRNIKDFTVWFISSLPYILLFAGMLTVVVYVCKKIRKKRKIRKQKRMQENS